MKLILALFLLLPSFALAGGFAVTLDSQSVVTVTGTSTQFLAANSAREYLLIQNNGTTNVIVKFGSAQTASEGVIIVAGGNYEPIKGIYDSVWMKSVSSTDSVTIVEGH